MRAGLGQSKAVQRKERGRGGGYVAPERRTEVGGGQDERYCIPFKKVHMRTLAWYYRDGVKESLGFAPNQTVLREGGGGKNTVFSRLACLLLSKEPVFPGLPKKGGRVGEYCYV